MSSSASSWMTPTMSSTVIWPTSRPAGVDHGRRDQVVLVEDVGDLFLVQVDR